METRTLFGVTQGREGDDDSETNRKRHREVSEGSFSLYYKTHLRSTERVVNQQSYIHGSSSIHSFRTID